MWPSDVYFFSIVPTLQFTHFVQCCNAWIPSYRFRFLCLKRYINLRWLFDAKSILVEKQRLGYSTHSWRKMEFILPLPKGISPKVIALARLEFELAYYDVAINHVSHYAIGTHLEADMTLLYELSSRLSFMNICGTIYFYNLAIYSLWPCLHFQNQVIPPLTFTSIRPMLNFLLHHFSRLNFNFANVIIYNVT